jgi:hypothetical protein
MKPQAVPLKEGPGAQRMKLSVDAYYNAIRPTAGNDAALVQVTLTLLFPP